MEAMRKYWFRVGGTIDWTMFGLGSVLHGGGPCYKLWGDMESESKRPIRSSKLHNLASTKTFPEALSEDDRKIIGGVIIEAEGR